MNKKFYFVPFKSGEKTKGEESGLYVRIQKPGNLVIMPKVMEALGFSDAGNFVSCYMDIEKRAFAFKIIPSVNKGANMKGIKFIKPYVTKKGYKYIQMCIRSFTNKLENVGIPSGRLTLEEYEDKDEYSQLGKVYYFVIPKDKNENQEMDKGI